LENKESLIFQLVRATNNCMSKSSGEVVDMCAILPPPIKSNLSVVTTVDLKNPQKNLQTNMISNNQRV